MGFDVHATALAAAGIETRSVSEGSSADRGSPSLTRRVTTETNLSLDGVNLIPYLTGQKQGRPHEKLFWRAGNKHAARVGDWKLVQERGFGPQIFDLANDIGEQNDLAASNPEKLKELQTAFAEWEKGTQPAKWVRQDARNAEIGGTLRPQASPTAASKPRAGARLETAFRNADKNGDGKVSADEYPQPAVFKDVDSNGDGFATLEEVKAFFAERRAALPATERPAQPAATPGSPQAAGELQAVDAVFELCVRDVEACAKFYRDGLGMREVESADGSKGALLEWAGCYLRLRKVPGERPTPASGNPMKQMLSQNGFRWFSLWFDDPAAVGQRLVKAGYPAPTKGGNVSMTRDPDGNVVEIMARARRVGGDVYVGHGRQRRNGIAEVLR